MNRQEQILIQKVVDEKIIYLKDLPREDQDRARNLISCGVLEIKIGEFSKEEYVIKRS